MSEKATIRVYLRNAGGAFFEYDVEAPSANILTAKVREHVGQIAAGGYRHCADGVFEWFPPHWIDKVKVTGSIKTSYPDRSGGT